MHTIWIEHAPGVFSKLEAPDLLSAQILWDALNDHSELGEYKLSARP